MEQVFSCELCSEEFNSRKELNAHVSQHAALSKRPRKQFKCNLCRFESSKKCHLIRHMRTHTGERPFKCTFDGCEMAFKQESNLKHHTDRQHSDERPLICSFPGCNFTAKTSANLISHKTVHSDEKPFACSECDYKTKRKNNLKSHKISLHSGKKNFKCSHPQCTKSFKSSNSLNRHFSNWHEERNLPCDHPGCDQKYANASALKKHKRDVHSKKTLVCPTLTCNYCTNYASKLARHMIVHHGRNEKISCSIGGCQYKAKNSITLEYHMRRHKTLLPCPKSGCGQYSLNKKALEDHAKLHNPSDRPFQCPLCCKYYQTLNKLQMHCFAHTTEKPFACGDCDYAAPFRSVIKRHISSVHRSIEFPFIIHLLDDRECLSCKVTLPTSEFLVERKGREQVEQDEIPKFKIL